MTHLAIDNALLCCSVGLFKTEQKLDRMHFHAPEGCIYFLGRTLFFLLYSSSYHLLGLNCICDPKLEISRGTVIIKQVKKHLVKMTKDAMIYDVLKS